MTLTQLITGHMRRHWQAYAASAAMLAAIAVLTVWIPRQVGAVVDGLVAGRLQGTALLHELALLVGAGAVIYLLRVGWRLALFGAAFKLGRDLRTRLYRMLTLQGPVFFQGQRTGDLMALATNDVDAVEMAAGEALLAAFDGSLTLLLVVSMMTVGIDWRLGLAALLPFPLMALAFARISEQVHKAWKSSLERFSLLNQHAQEGLSSVRTLRALGLAERNAGQFAALAGDAAEAGYRAQRWEAAFEPAVGMTLTTALVIALGLGGWLVARQELSIGQLTAFTMYLGQLIWPMFAAGWVLSLLERGRAAWARLAPMLDAPLTLDASGHLAPPAGAPLRVEGLGFAYPVTAPDMPRPALQDISLTLAPGQTLGLVGPTGAGKSTLLKLLLRQFEPDSGRILLGAHALREIELQALRLNLAWVPPLYRGATLMTPNTKETSELTARPARSDMEVAVAGRALMAELGLKGLLVTRSERGMALFAPGGDHAAPWMIATEAREVFDVSGAGDTVIAAFSAAVAAGADWRDAAMLANAAAGVVVGKIGTATVTPAELLAHYHEQEAN